MNEEFDNDKEDFYTIETPIEGVRIIYKALTIAVDKWPGGDPEEQQSLLDMRDNFFRILLDYQFNHTDSERPDDN